MKRDIDPRIEAELMAGERVLWIGQPDPMRLLFRAKAQTGASSRLRLILASLMFLLVGAFIAAGVAPSVATMILLLATLVLLIAGAIGGSLFSRYAQVKNTVYAVTDRRALVKTGKQVRSYGENDIRFIERHSPDAYTGDVIFNTEQAETFVPIGMIVARKQHNVPVGFFNIPDAAEVEAIMLDTFRAGADDGLFYDADDEGDTDEDMTYYDNEQDTRRQQQ